MDVEEETSGLLESLTPDDVRVLVQSEDELSRCGSFKRVFPGGRHGDVTLLAHRRYYNLLLAAWERRFGHQRHKGRQAFAERMTHPALHHKIPCVPSVWPQIQEAFGAEDFATSSVLMMASSTTNN
ncbi:hypothetical protein MTO96_045227 [Rhipicephalus appendiculatus]